MQDLHGKSISTINSYLDLSRASAEVQLLQNRKEPISLRAEWGTSLELQARNNDI